jgi:hypothetical protein
MDDVEQACEVRESAPFRRSESLELGCVRVLVELRPGLRNQVLPGRPIEAVGNKRCPEGGTVVLRVAESL